MFFSILAMAVLLLAGCGDGNSSNESEKSTAAKLTKPQVQPPSGAPPKQLLVKDLKKGSGPAAKVGDKIRVNFVAVDKTGKEVYTSWNYYGPYTFQLGASGGQAWKEGLEGMKVGGRRELTIPPNSSNGEKTLVYVVDLLAAEPLPWADRERTKPKIQVPNGPPPKKLTIEDPEEGSGAAAKDGAELLIHYVGVNYKTGKEFEASWDPVTPFPVVLGSGAVLKGWEEGLKGMKVGGRRELIVPPNLAYKTDTLIYVIDLLAIKK